MLHGLHYYKILLAKLTFRESRRKILDIFHEELAFHQAAC